MYEPAVPSRSGSAGQEFGIDPLDAMRVVAGRAIRTEVRRLRWLERWTGVPVWAKLECHQITGSFKYRGACYRLSKLNHGQTVIAASAGNHGLAVAEVARSMGIRANICVPTNASPLKCEHILATGQGLIPFGNSLEEATHHAIGLAQRHGWSFVSPYNDPDIIAGQSTIAIELLEDVPEIEIFVAPVGGGGLVCGLALGARAIDRPVRVFGVEPERYASLSASLKQQASARVPHQPTIADGLAVNLEPESITVDLAEDLLEGIVQISEEELAAATLAVLFHESLLVEPAGAAAILGCVRLAAQGLLSGPVALPLCGGNLHHTTLARLQHWPFSLPICRDLLDLRSRPVERQPSPKVVSPLPAPTFIADTSAVDFLYAQLGHCLAEANRFETKVADFTEFCRNRDLLLPQNAIDMLRGVAASSRALAEGALSRLARPPGGVDDVSDAVALCEADLRAAIQGLVAARNGLEWRSAAFGQSRVAQFFDVGSQDSPGVNYDRYEHADVKRIERQLAEAFGIQEDRLAVTVTSSGMASYALLEAHLLRSSFKPGTSVVVAPYLYFEAYEQIQSLPGLKILRAEGYDIGSILAAVESHRPVALFVDPLANNVDQRMIDVAGLIVDIKMRGLGPIAIVIDGSMLPTACAGLAQGHDGVDVYYYESCSKYLQFGLDITMAGAVVHPAREKPRFDRLRRNLGLMLYPGNAQTFPAYDQRLLEQRVARIEKNAAFIAERLAVVPAVTSVARVIHPMLPSHPDHAIARALTRGGGCVTFDFLHKGDGHRDQLEALIEIILSEAGTRRVPLVKGVSFGFTQPRISAAASMSESEPPFLRLYAGDLARAHCEALCEACAAGFRKWTAGC